VIVKQILYVMLKSKFGSVITWRKVGLVDF
jgi:hypothetical protein